MNEEKEITTERVLEEVTLEITNFEEEYEGEWWRVKEKVDMMKAIYTEQGGHCGYLGGWAEETMGSFFKWTMDEV